MAEQKTNGGGGLLVLLCVIVFLVAWPVILPALVTVIATAMVFVGWLFSVLEPVIVPAVEAFVAAWQWANGG